MPIRFLAAMLLAAVSLAFTFRPARDDASPACEVEEILRGYLLKNPEVILEALEVLEARNQAAQEDRQQATLALHREELERDAASPVLGNPRGDVTIVEFFDYQCGYCKQASVSLRELLEKDSGVRLVMKEFPILGPASLIGARAALAAKRQEGYEELHWALMAHRGQLSEESILSLAPTWRTPPFKRSCGRTIGWPKRCKFAVRQLS